MLSFDIWGAWFRGRGCEISIFQNSSAKSVNVRRRAVNSPHVMKSASDSSPATAPGNSNTSPATVYIHLNHALDEQRATLGPPLGFGCKIEPLTRPLKNRTHTKFWEPHIEKIHENHSNFEIENLMIFMHFFHKLVPKISYYEILGATY